MTNDEDPYKRETEFLGHIGNFDGAPVPDPDPEQERLLEELRTAVVGKDPWAIPNRYSMNKKPAPGSANPLSPEQIARMAVAERVAAFLTAKAAPKGPLTLPSTTPPPVAAIIELTDYIMTGVTADDDDDDDDEVADDDGLPPGRRSVNIEVETIGARSFQELITKIGEMSRSGRDGDDGPTDKQIFDFNLGFAGQETDDPDTISTEVVHPWVASDARVGWLTQQYRVVGVTPDADAARMVLQVLDRATSRLNEITLDADAEVNVVCAACTLQHRHEMDTHPGRSAG